METSRPRNPKKTILLPLYDEEGNPTEILFGLRSIYEDGKFTAYNLFQGINFDLIPNGLSSKYVWQMAHGKGRKKKIPKNHYEFLKNKFLSKDTHHPNAVLAEEKTVKDDDAYQGVTIVISPQFKIRTLKSIRLSEKPITDFFLDKELVPEGLTPEKLIDMLQSPVKEIPKSYYDFVKQNWQKINPGKHPNRLNILVPVFASYKKQIARNIERSQKPIEEYFLNKKFVPDGLTAEYLINWLQSDSMELKGAYVEFVTRHWWNIIAKKTESKPPKPEIIILNDIVMDEMMKEFRRTGIGILKAIKYVDTLPKGLSPRTIKPWFEKKNRYYPTAKKEHMDFILNIYRSLPDKMKK